MVMGHACVSPTSREQPVSFVQKATNLAHFVIKVSFTKNVMNVFNQNQGPLAILPVPMTRSITPRFVVLPPPPSPIQCNYMLLSSNFIRLPQRLASTNRSLHVIMLYINLKGKRFCNRVNCPMLKIITYVPGLDPKLSIKSLSDRSHHLLFQLEALITNN